MQLFYQPDLNEESREVEFSREESAHISRVLRKKIGDHLEITNGAGMIFSCEMTAMSKKACIARVLRTRRFPPPPYHLHLAVAPTKMNDRYEWFLEKATEIGVQEITPVYCERSERRTVKKDRLERVLQSALKQSLQVYLPVLNEPMSLEHFVAQDLPGQKFIAHCEEQSEKIHLLNALEKEKQIHILIGPEGDFSPEEIQQVLNNQWRPVSLGENRLRTETAAIVACTSVANKFVSGF